MPREQHHLQFLAHLAAASSGPQNKLARLLAHLARNLPMHRTTLIGLVRSHLQPQDYYDEAPWTLFLMQPPMLSSLQSVAHSSQGSKHGDGGGEGGLAGWLVVGNSPLRLVSHRHTVAALQRCYSTCIMLEIRCRVVQFEDAMCQQSSDLGRRRRCCGMWFSLQLDYSSRAVE